MIAGDLCFYDSKEAYMGSLVFGGLSDMWRRDSVREGDAECIESDTRISMIEYYNQHHTNYLKITHHLLSGKKGFTN